jgi:hypothetical protein
MMEQTVLLMAGNKKKEKTKIPKSPSRAQDIDLRLPKKPHLLRYHLPIAPCWGLSL